MLWIHQGCFVGWSFITWCTFIKPTLVETANRYWLTSGEDVVLVSLWLSPGWNGHGSGDCVGEASPWPPNADCWPQIWHYKQRECLKWDKMLCTFLNSVLYSAFCGPVIRAQGVSFHSLSLSKRVTHFFRELACVATQIKPVYKSLSVKVFSSHLRQITFFYKTTQTSEMGHCNILCGLTLI